MAAGLDYSAVDVSEATFRDVFLPPFIAGVEAGALTLMSAFVAIVGGIPVCSLRLVLCWFSSSCLMVAVVTCRRLEAAGSKRRSCDRSLGLRDLSWYVAMRDVMHRLLPAAAQCRLGSDCAVAAVAALVGIQSDYEADLELIDHGYASNESDAAFKALWAGVDMSMQSGLYREYLPGLAKEGILSMDTLDEAVRRVLDSKARMGATCMHAAQSATQVLHCANTLAAVRLASSGLFDDPYRSLDSTREASAHYSVAHDELALTAARCSFSVPLPLSS